jgi:8-oxo-dGTP diphosphatase
MKRKGSHGADTWAFCGGHIEQGETPLITAANEASQELGITLWDSKLLKFVACNTMEGNYYVTLFVKSGFYGMPTIKEKDKCDAISYFHETNLPPNLFPPTKAYFDALNYRAQKKQEKLARIIARNK